MLVRLNARDEVVAVFRRPQQGTVKIANDDPRYLAWLDSRKEPAPQTDEEKFEDASSSDLRWRALIKWIAADKGKTVRQITDEIKALI